MVVVSASDRASDVIRAIDLGAMGFVPKRSSHGELHEALRMVMSGSMYVPPSMLGLDLPGGPADGDTVPGVMRPAPARHPVDQRPGPRAPPDATGLDRRRGPDPAPGRSAVLLLQGLPNKLIARQMSLSVDTVKDHVAAVLRALGVTSRTQAVLTISQMTQRAGSQGAPVWKRSQH